MSDEITQEILSAITKALPDSRVEIQPNGGGHYAIAVRSAQFAGKTTLARHRLVLSAIAYLMDGERAKVHAIDTLTTDPT